MLSITTDGFWHPSAKEALVSTVRDCVGEPPHGERWNLTISASPSGLPYHRVTITTPNQRREKYFFDIDTDLGQSICAWLGSYPLR